MHAHVSVHARVCACNKGRLREQVNFFDYMMWWCVYWLSRKYARNVHQIHVLSFLYMFQYMFLIRSKILVPVSPCAWHLNGIFNTPNPFRIAQRIREHYFQNGLFNKRLKKVERTIKRTYQIGRTKLARLWRGETQKMRSAIIC